MTLKNMWLSGFACGASLSLLGNVIRQFDLLTQKDLDPWTSIVLIIVLWVAGVMMWRGK